MCASQLGQVRVSYPLFTDKQTKCRRFAFAWQIDYQGSIRTAIWYAAELVVDSTMCYTAESFSILKSYMKLTQCRSCSG